MLDCDVYKYEASWWEFNKIIAKTITDSVVKVVSYLLLQLVNVDCSFHKLNDYKAEYLNQVKNLLLNKTNLFTKTEFDQIHIEWCQIKISIPGYSNSIVSGMVPRPNEILLNIDDSDIYSNTHKLAVVLAHEVHHVRQINDWGYEVFDCLYANEILFGNGFEENNWIEKDAYNFEREVESNLVNNLTLS
jgi:hypothetical protein